MDPDVLELPQTCGDSSLSPPPQLLEATPSNTTVTLATPDPGHAQLAGVECHNPLRFIFYPISWDGSEDPSMQSKPTAPPVLSLSDIHISYADDDRVGSPSIMFCSTDAFWSIDRWRRDVVKCDDAAADLLDPIQDVDTPLPLLSFPHDQHRGLSQCAQLARTPSRGPDSNSSEDEVQLWIHP